MGQLLDIRTLLIVVAIVALVNAAAWLRWSARQGRFSGLAYIASANAPPGVSMALVALRGELPEVMTIVVANVAALSGLLLNHLGLCRSANAG